ncbi:MAG: tetratricopeptide repeat protein, partial [Candidatus Altarchaeaceae archaeon]
MAIFVKDPKLVELEKKASEYLNSGKISEIEKICKEGISLSEKLFEKADINFFNGILCYGKNEKNKAIKFLKEAIKLDKYFLLAHYNLGNLYMETGKYKLAREEYIKCIEIDKNFADAYFNLGILSKNSKNYKEAIDYFNKALEIYEKTNYAKAINTRWWIKNLEEKEKSEEKKKTIEESVIDAVVEELKDEKERILNQIKNKEEEFKRFVSDKRTINSEKNFLIVLRRWNSYTPALSSELERSKGGGYFLSWQGKGIVIDPGFNFIENFLSNGLRIADIDAIFLTHSHLDHTADFESLMTLIFEHNDNLQENEKKKVDLFLNVSSLNKFGNLISVDNASINKIYILQQGDVMDFREKYNFKLKVTYAQHREIYGYGYSTGLIFDLYYKDINEKEKIFRIGFTMDTGYTEQIGKQFSDSDILVAHIGSIKEKEFNLDLPIQERLYKTHLGLIGTAKIIEDSKPSLAIISEFGEELGNQRVDIVKAIERVVKSKRIKRVIPGDIGMKILIPNIKIKCDWCSNEKHEEVFVDINEINPIYIPEKDSKDIGKIMYVCKKHF